MALFEGMRELGAMSDNTCVAMHREIINHSLLSYEEPVGSGFRVLDSGET